MAKITRATQLLFGTSAGTNQMSEFGSLAASYPTVPTRYSGSTITPALVQGLSNYLTGWDGAVVAGNSPAIEDMNALCYLFSYQLGYLLQQGVPEWDSGTTYYTNSFCQVSGTIYISLQNSNLNNAPASSPSYWGQFANQNPMTALGDMIYGGSSPAGTETRLAGNTTANQQLLAQTGTGSASQAPGWITQIGRPNLPSLGQQVSGSSGIFSTSSATPVAVTNLSISITTTGRPVYMMLTCDGISGHTSYISSVSSSSSSTSANFSFTQNGSPIATFEVGATGSTSLLANSIPPSSIAFLADPAAGTYTFAVTANVNAATSLNVVNVSLIVWET